MTDRSEKWLERVEKLVADARELADYGDATVTLRFAGAPDDVYEHYLPRAEANLITKCACGSCGTLVSVFEFFVPAAEEDDDDYGVYVVFSRTATEDETVEYLDALMLETGD